MPGWMGESVRMPSWTVRTELEGRYRLDSEFLTDGFSPASMVFISDLKIAFGRRFFMTALLKTFSPNTLSGVFSKNSSGGADEL